MIIDLERAEAALQSEAAVGLQYMPDDLLAGLRALAVAGDELASTYLGMRETHVDAADDDLRRLRNNVLVSAGPPFRGAE